MFCSASFASANKAVHGRSIQSKSPQSGMSRGVNLLAENKGDVYSRSGRHLAETAIRHHIAAIGRTGQPRPPGECNWLVCSPLP